MITGENSVVLGRLYHLWESTGDIEIVLHAAIDEAEERIAQRECFSSVQCCQCFEELADCWVAFSSNLSSSPEFIDAMLKVDKRSIFWAYLDLYVATAEGRVQAPHYSIRTTEKPKPLSLDLPSTLKMLCTAFDAFLAAVRKTNVVPERLAAVYASRLTSKMLMEKLCVPGFKAIVDKRQDLGLDTDEVHLYMFGLYSRVCDAMREARGAFSLGEPADKVTGYTISFDGDAACTDRVQRMLTYMLKARMFIAAVQTAGRAA